MYNWKMNWLIRSTATMAKAIASSQPSNSPLKVRLAFACSFSQALRALRLVSNRSAVA